MSRFCLAVFPLIAAVALPAGAQAPQAVPRSVSAAPARPAAARPRDGLPVYVTYDEWLIVRDQNLYLPVIDEVGRNLRDADRAARRHEAGAAAAALRRASTSLRSLPAVDARGRTALERNARALDALAGELDRGVIEPRRLANAYRRSYETEVACYWAHVSDHQWALISRRFSRHLQRGLAEFPTDPRAAADDLRKAEAYLRLDELRQPAPILRRSERELAQLADRIDSGRVHDPAILDDAAANAEHALAQMHYVQARAAWMARNEAVALEQLREVSDHLRWAAKGASAELKAAADSLDEETRRLVSEGEATWSATAQRVERDLRQARDMLGRLGYRITRG